MAIKALTTTDAPLAASGHRPARWPASCFACKILGRCADRGSQIVK